jgi:hypothetical protein
MSRKPREQGRKPGADSPCDPRSSLTRRIPCASCSPRLFLLPLTTPVVAQGVNKLVPTEVTTGCRRQTDAGVLRRELPVLAPGLGISCSTGLFGVSPGCGPRWPSSPRSTAGLNTTPRCWIRRALAPLRARCSSSAATASIHPKKSDQRHAKREACFIR